MSSLQMPKVDSSILSKKDKIVSEMGRMINPKNVLSHPDELRPFETDGLTAYRQMPLVVVMPETVEEVSNILKYCNDNKVKVVPRGAPLGTTLTLLSLQYFNILLTSSTVSGMTTTKGICLYAVKPSVSKGLNSSGCERTFLGFIILPISETILSFFDKIELSTFGICKLLIINST